MGQGMVRVDRGDGKVFNFQPNDVDAFIKANPGARRVDAPSPSNEPTAAEQAATAALSNQPDVDNMTVAQLKTYADENEIDLEGASVKADIIAAIKNAEASD